MFEADNIVKNSQATECFNSASFSANKFQSAEKKFVIRNVINLRRSIPEAKTLDKCNCDQLFHLCNAVLLHIQAFSVLKWHKEPIGIHSGRRVYTVGWTLGFRQANSNQKFKKTREQEGQWQRD